MGCRKKKVLRRKFPVMCLHLKKEKDFTWAILHPELVKGKIREEIKEIEHEKITVVIINHTKDQ